MTCFHPMLAVVDGVTSKGKKRLRFITSVRSKEPWYKVIFAKMGFFIPKSKSITVPCGRCSGCRLERSRQWAMRIMHESSFYEDNCFITLTYDDDHLPSDGSLNVRDFQLFMKRFRKEYSNVRIRFFHCGEYGEQSGRPHFHACIFNFDFVDKVFFTERNGYTLYSSESLSRLWPFGYCSVGSLTFESAAYVARYIMKKVTGKDADDHYMDIDDFTGEVFTLKPEYVTMSRRPGIGKNWFDKYGDHTYLVGDYVVMNGRKVRPPKYYDSQFELISPDILESVKDSRKAKALKNVVHTTADRLAVRENLQLRRLNFLPRNGDF